MRPRKVILYVSDKELDLSIMKFMLETNGFRVLTALTSHEAVAYITERQVELVLADYEMKPTGGDTLVRGLKKIAPSIPMVLLGDPYQTANQVHCADALLDKRRTQPWELLERIRVMSARKRGPKPGSTSAMKCGPKPVARETAPPQVKVAV